MAGWVVTGLGEVIAFEYSWSREEHEGQATLTQWIDITATWRGQRGRHPLTKIAAALAPSGLREQAPTRGSGDSTVGHTT